MKEATEIKELDMNKYLVLKWKDLNKLQISDCHNLDNILNNVAQIRRDEGKQDNKYLVLNLDDGIDLACLFGKNSPNIILNPNPPAKVKDIALALVNAILKAKEKP